jgi:NAD(P)-dependent dehydrogenase (short-subunit alcohol dehydrogenase family)
MGELSGKIAIVTGSGRGIGQAIARGLAKEGATVVLTSRSADELDQTKIEIESAGGTASALAGDITSEAFVQSLFDFTVRTYGTVDLLVANAGIFDGGALEALSLDTWNRVVATNLTAPFLCTREAFKIMKPKGAGRIIYVASISAQRVRPNNGPYNASKHGVWGLAQTAALEGRPHGIAVGCLNPGNTRIRRNELGQGVNDSEPMMSTDELARVAVLMAMMPPHVTVLEATVIPVEQLFVGRG